MKNFITCPNCVSENRAVRKVCYSCGYSFRSFPVSSTSARNIEIVRLRDDLKMTFSEIGIKYSISPARVRQIYVQDEWRKKNKIILDRISRSKIML